MIELTCRDVLACLADYLSQELSTAERLAFAAHIAACDACVVYIRTYETAVRLGTAAYDDAIADPELVKRLAAAILAARGHEDEG
jgi:anti-sigma factor RsiW